MLRALAVPGLAAALLLAGCGGEDEPPPAPVQLRPGVQVVNESDDDVLVRWYPKADEPSRGSTVVHACRTELVAIPGGSYTLVVSTPRGPISFSWIVTSELRCCLRIAANGRPNPTTRLPPPVRC